MIITQADKRLAGFKEFTTEPERQPPTGKMAQAMAIVRMMGEATSKDVANVMGGTPDQVYYHLNLLRNWGWLEVVSKVRRERGGYLIHYGPI